MVQFPSLAGKEKDFIKGKSKLGRVVVNKDSIDGVLARKKRILLQLSSAIITGL